MRQRVILSMLLLGALCATAVGQTTKPAYSDTNEGLEQFFKELLAASDANDQVKLLSMCEAFLLPKPQTWFKKVFGDKVGARLATDYENETKDLGMKFALLFIRLPMSKELTITVTRVETRDDPNAKVYQLFAMEAMKYPVSLYSVVIGKEGTAEAIGLWSIVYVDGTFRFAGKMMTIREAVKQAS